jgi:hypothetical protein
MHRDAVVSDAFLSPDSGSFHANRASEFLPRGPQSDFVDFLHRSAGVSGLAAQKLHIALLRRLGDDLNAPLRRSVRCRPAVTRVD